jgi:hypothetical protein
MSTNEKGGPEEDSGLPHHALVGSVLKKDRRAKRRKESATIRRRESERCRSVVVHWVALISYSAHKTKATSSKRQ